MRRPIQNGILIANVLAAALACAACGQQAYRVFAVQVASAPAAAATLGAGAAQGQFKPAHLADSAGALIARHPVLDLNLAPAASLAVLPGIDSATVEAIVAGRPYRAKRELLKRKILSPAQYARWKVYLVVHRGPASGQAKTASGRGAEFGGGAATTARGGGQ